MGKAKFLPAIIWKEDKFFVAKTLAVEIASQGKTRKQALKNLQEAVELCFEDEDPTKISLPLIHRPQVSKIPLSY